MPFDFGLCFLRDGAISWHSKKQATVTTSIMEAEYMASCHVKKEAMWLCTLLNLIGFKQEQPTLISCDNNSSNMLGWDPSFHKRTKHIDIQYNYVHKWVEAKDMLFSHIPSCENLSRMGFWTNCLSARRPRSREKCCEWQ